MSNAVLASLIMQEIAILVLAIYSVINAITVKRLSKTIEELEKRLIRVEDKTKPQAIGWKTQLLDSSCIPPTVKVETRKYGDRYYER